MLLFLDHLYLVTFLSIWLFYFLQFHFEGAYKNKHLVHAITSLIVSRTHLNGCGLGQVLRFAGVRGGIEEKGWRGLSRCPSHFLSTSEGITPIINQCQPVITVARETLSCKWLHSHLPLVKIRYRLLYLKKDGHVINVGGVLSHWFIRYLTSLH